MLAPADDLRHPAEISGVHGRESIFHNLLLPELGLLVFVYTWVDANDRAGYMFGVSGDDDRRRLFFADDGIEVGSQDFDDWSIGGLRLRHTDPLATAELSFTDGDQVIFEATFRALHDAFSYRDNADGCPSFVATDRFEQAGSIRGGLLLDGERIDFDTTAHRDHSWGQRDWTAIQDWKWVAAQAGDVALNLFVMRALGDITYHGYVAREGKVVPVVHVDIHAEYDERWWQTRTDITATDAEGVETAITGERFALLSFEAGGVARLNEAACTGTIDGMPALVHLECGWPSAYAAARQASHAAVVHLDEIDAQWLTGAMRAAGTLNGGRVAAVERETCGTGQLADSYRFTLHHEPPGSGPATVVGKFPSDDATSRAFGQQSGYYRNEIRFYEELAPSLSVALPTPIHAALATNETDFVLLMEDLSPARVVDQLVGCTPDEAALVMEQAARLHAGSWKSAELAAVGWLQGTASSFVGVTDNFPQTTRTFAETFGDLVPEADVAQAARLNEHLDTWKAIFTASRCLWHSDLRADNLLFDAQDGTVPVAVLDWQGVGYGCGTIDVAYFLGTSLTTEDRRAHERDLVRLYHRALVAHGVEDYDAETCWEDYRILAIHGLQVGVFGVGAVKRSARGDEMWRTWIERAAAQTRDLDSFPALAAR